MAAPIFRLQVAGESNGFVGLCHRFQALFARGDGQVRPVWDLDEARARSGPIEGPSLPEALRDEWAGRLRDEVAAARHYLPIAYQEAFVAPLLGHLDHVVRSDDDVRRMHGVVEALAGAVVQHRPGHAVRQPLRQFLAVVSNLVRSFLAADKRISAGVPLSAPALPPLVCFHPDRRFGPAVLASPMTQLLCGAEVAVVAMPSTYARDPLSWLALAHEACGHGVLQADPDLLPDLVAGVRALFGGGPLPAGADPNRDQALGLLWSYWIEETASDVYGLLNIGPAFALNLAAFLAGRRMADDPARPAPWLEVQSGGDPSVDLDVHPTDLLRLHVAIGVVENLVGLSGRRIGEYARILRAIADRCAANAWQIVEPASRRKVVIRGRVEVGRDRWVPLDLRLDVAEAAESARRVGAYIASTRLGALNNRTIQDVETWDDADEAFALKIRDALLAPPLIHPAEADEEARRRIMDDARFTGPRMDEILAKLRDDRFADLDDDERAGLGLAGLDAAQAAALQADRIEEVRDPATVRALGLDRIETLGDDGQLLAGAALAALGDPSPGAYRWINRRLAAALNRSHRHDSIMGFAEVHRMFRDPTGHTQPPREVEKDVLEQAVAAGAAAKPHPAPAAG